MNRWTADEVKILEENYSKIPNSNLCDLLGRSWLSIYKKARALGFYKTPESKFYEKSMSKSGSKSSNWKGGRRITKKGYVQILCKGHHRADSNGYVMEHIYVFEKETGISVPLNCDVHHINGNKRDNRISNLCLMTHGAHTTLHNKEGKKS